MERIKITLINIFNKIANKNVKKEESHTFQEWLNIKEITTNGIKLNTGQNIVILKVSPINFNLKSKLEQQAILDAYKIFLKNLNSEIQIIISSKKTDVSKHLNKILKNTKENSPIYEMSKDYIELINNIIENKGTITKEFYIIINSSNNIQNEIIKITESLAVCGNFVEECSKVETVMLLRDFLNKRLINIGISN